MSIGNINFSNPSIVQERTNKTAEHAEKIVHMEKQKVAEANTKEHIKTSVEKQREEENASEEKVKEIADNLNRSFELLKVEQRFQIHNKTHEMMIKIVNSETQEVIREIPPQELLDRIAHMRELVGIIFDKKV